MVGSHWETLEVFWSRLDTKQKNPCCRCSSVRSIGLVPGRPGDCRRGRPGTLTQNWAVSVSSLLNPHRGTPPDPLCKAHDLNKSGNFWHLVFPLLFGNPVLWVAWLYEILTCRWCCPLHMAHKSFTFFIWLLVYLRLNVKGIMVSLVSRERATHGGFPIAFLFPCLDYHVSLIAET